MPERPSATVLSAAVALTMSGVAAQAADPAICAVEQVIACAPFDPCERSLPGAANLPALMRLDPAARVVVSRFDDGTERRSEVASLTETDEAVILQGADEGHPWLMRILKESGRFSLATAQAEATFMAFGVCSAELLK